MNIDNIMEEVKKKVADKRETGVYEKYNLDNITTKDIKELHSEKDFLNYYMELIQHTCDIDIGDFEIPSKGGIFGKPMAKLKRVIWIMLRFYTYRLFSQQKEFNFQLVNAITSLNKRLDKIEKKIDSK